VAIHTQLDINSLSGDCFGSADLGIDREKAVLSAVTRAGWLCGCQGAIGLLCPIFISFLRSGAPRVCVVRDVVADGHRQMERIGRAPVPGRRIASPV
jgi:hypothetical protein